MLARRFRPFAAAALLLVLAGLAAWVGLAVGLRGWHEDRVEEELTVRAEAALRLVPARLDAASGDAEADELGALLDSRVTLIGPDGVLWGDTALDAAGLAAADNHAGRPEVLAATASGRGTATRFSETLGKDMIYVAVPLRGGGWLRVARPVARMDEALRPLRATALAALLVTLAAGLAAAGLNALLMGRSLRSAVAAARARSGAGEGGDDGVDESLEGSLGVVTSRLGVLVSELAASRDRLRLTLETLEDGVVALSAEGNVTAVNVAAQRLLGSEIEEGRPPSPEVAEWISRASAVRVPPPGSGAGDPPEPLELVVPGRPPVQVAAALGRAADGGRVVVFRDVTNKLRVDRIRRDFVANASHELRTPVAVVQATAETLLDGALDDPEAARRFVEAIHRSSRRLGALLADLLDLSRIEAGRYAMDPVPLRVADALDRARETVSGKPDGEGVDIVQEVPADLLVLGDPRALDQVLVNLLDNAVKYTPEGGRVLLQGRRSDDRVRIEVRDDGPGIPEAARDRLFERFYRVDPGRDRSIGGTGLGLAIVKHLAGAMHGTVGMEPNSPRGSVFWVELPRP